MEELTVYFLIAFAKYPTKSDRRNIPAIAFNIKIEFKGNEVPDFYQSCFISSIHFFTKSLAGSMTSFPAR